MGKQTICTFDGSKQTKRRNPKWFCGLIVIYVLVFGFALFLHWLIATSIRNARCHIMYPSYSPTPPPPCLYWHAQLVTEPPFPCCPQKKGHTMNGKDAAQRPKNRRHVANDVAAQQLPKRHGRGGERCRVCRGGPHKFVAATWKIVL